MEDKKIEDKCIELTTEGLIRRDLIKKGFRYLGVGWAALSLFSLAELSGCESEKSSLRNCRKACTICTICTTCKHCTTPT